MNPKLKSRLFLLLIAAACAAPVVLSLLTYYVWKPQRKLNYGELLARAPVPLSSLVDLKGGRLDGPEPNGRWVLLLAEPSACAGACRARLYAMRQSWLAMGIKRDLLARVWLVTDGGSPDPDLVAAYPGLQRARSDAVLQSLPAPSQGRIFLIDPHADLVLRYPAQTDPGRLIRDLARLLDVKRM